MGKRTAWKRTAAIAASMVATVTAAGCNRSGHAASVSLVEFGSGVVVAQLAHTKPGSVRVLPAPRTERAASAQAEPGRARSERGGRGVTVE